MAFVFPVYFRKFKVKKLAHFMCAIQPATGTISWLCVPSDVDFCQPFLSTFSVPPFVFSLCISSSLSFAIVLISQKQIRVSWWCGSWKICLIAIRLALNFNRVMPLSYAHILCVQSNPIFRFISILFRFSFFLCVSLHSRVLHCSNVIDDGYWGHLHGITFTQVKVLFAIVSLTHSCIFHSKKI